MSPMIRNKKWKDLIFFLKWTTFNSKKSKKNKFLMTYLLKRKKKNLNKKKTKLLNLLIRLGDIY